MTATDPSATRAAIQCISAATALRLLEAEPAVTLFDVRDVVSYRRGHLDAAMHLSEDRVHNWLVRLPKEQPIVIYCHRGHASKSYSRMFVDFHFRQVFSVDGGYEALAAAMQAPPGLADKEAIAAGRYSPALATFLAEWDFAADNLDAPRTHGLTPLMRAALGGERVLVRELMQLGADVHRRNHDGNTALWLACVARDAGIVADLIAAGIDLDNRNDAGATALMYTASSDRPELLAVLLAAGADPLLKNLDDMRAVELAGSLACLRLLRQTAD
jgi:rhodanese-related sulfurtransferase